MTELLNATIGQLLRESRQTQGYSEGDLRSLVRSLASALETATKPAAGGEALAWADGDGFGILTRLGVRSTQGDRPTDKRPGYGMDCDPREILIAAHVALCGSAGNG